MMLTRQIDLAGSRSVQIVLDALTEIVADDCSLHSRYYYDGNSFQAECISGSFMGEIVRVVDAIEVGSGVQHHANGVRFDVMQSDGVVSAISIAAAHWVCDYQSMNQLVKRIRDRLSGSHHRPTLLSRPAYDAAFDLQHRRSIANMKRLEDNRSIPIESHIPTRSACNYACHSLLCRSIQHELGYDLSRSSMETIRMLAREERIQPSTIAFASFCKAIAEKWNLSTVAVVTLFGDRSGPIGESIVTLINPRPVWIGGFERPQKEFLGSTQRELLKVATLGFLESFDEWYAAALGARSETNVRVSFNFVHREKRQEPVGTRSTVRDDGGRSLHQTWFYNPEGAHIHVATPECCGSADDLVALVRRQVELLEDWRIAVS